MTTKMRVLLLGPLQVVQGTDEFDVRGTLQRTLLVRLALAEGRPVTTHALIDDLWGDDRPRRVDHALQAQISRLRATVPVDIERVDDAYRFVNGTVTTDAQEFVELCGVARTQLEQNNPQMAAHMYDRAMVLWRGPVASYVAEVPGLRQFALGLDETWRTTRAERIDAYLRSGRSEEVIAELRSALEIDPLHERGWSQLMRALRDAGRPQEALAAFREAREVFVNELGTEPAEHLSQLHAEMLGGRTGAKQPSARQHGAERVMLFDPPAHLIGRASEWEVLRRTLKHGREGLDVITLSGEAGIGKSRLADAFAREARAAGWRVLEGHCSSLDQRPYEPFADMLRRYLEEHPGLMRDERIHLHAVGLARVLPEFAVEFGVPEARMTTVQVTPDYRALGAVLAWLATVSSDERVVVLIEDLHLADAATLVLLQHLIRRSEGVNALLIVTTRDEHSPRLDAVTQSDTVTHVQLQPLGEDHVRSLIVEESAAYVRREPPEWLSTYVAGASGGNPLFVVELTRHLVATGADSAPVDAPVPVGLRQVILARFAALPDHAQTVLTQAAAIGAEFDVQLVAAITGQSLEAVDEAVQVGLRTRLVESVDGRAGMLTFSHDIIRAVLSDAPIPVERAHLHRSIADAIERRGGNLASHYTLLAHHYRLTDDDAGRQEAVRYLSLAGREALKRDAPVDAVVHFREAADLLGEGSLAVERCDALIELGGAQLQAANPSYRETLLEAARIAIELQDARRLAEAVLANSRGWWSSAISVDYERLEAIETALAWCDDANTRTRALLLGNWAVESVRDPDSRDAVLTRSAEGLRLAEDAAEDSVLATALMQRYTVLFALFEHTAECLRLNERLLGLSRILGDRSLRLSASIGLAQTMMRMGEFSIADRYLAQSAQLAQALNHPPRYWLVLGWQAMRELMRGRIDNAEALIYETYAYGQHTDQHDAFTWFAGQLFTLRMLQGRLPEMLSELHEHVPTVADGIPAWRAAMALACAEAGEVRIAHELVDDLMADHIVRLPKDMLWLHGLTYLARTCEILGRVEDVAVLIAKLEPYAGMVATNGTIDAGPVDLTLGILSSATGDVHTARARLDAAVSLARRIEAPLWLRQAQARLDAIPLAS